MKDFFELPDHSRVWIYAAHRDLTQIEVAEIHESLNQFLKEWSSHGKNMDAASLIEFDRIVVIAVDESAAMASGCGIDKSVRFMQDLGAKWNIDFFKRTQTFYFEGDLIRSKELNEFWAMKKAGLLLDETLILDNAIKTLGEFKNKWKIPFSKSWHAEMWLR